MGGGSKGGGERGGGQLGKGEEREKKRSKEEGRERSEEAKVPTPVFSSFFFPSFHTPRSSRGAGSL